MLRGWRTLLAPHEQDGLSTERASWAAAAHSTPTSHVDLSPAASTSFFTYLWVFPSILLFQLFFGGGWWWCNLIHLDSHVEKPLNGFPLHVKEHVNWIWHPGPHWVLPHHSVSFLSVTNSSPDTSTLAASENHWGRGEKLPCPGAPLSYSITFSGERTSVSEIQSSPGDFSCSHDWEPVLKHIEFTMLYLLQSLLTHSSNLMVDYKFLQEGKHKVFFVISQSNLLQYLAHSRGNFLSLANTLYFLVLPHSRAFWLHLSCRIIFQGIALRSLEEDKLGFGYLSIFTDWILLFYHSPLLYLSIQWICRWKVSL